MNQLVALKPSLEQDASARFTRAEFLRMIDTGAFAGMKVELIHGRLERLTPPVFQHGRLVAALCARLEAIFSSDSTVVVVADAGIDLGEDTMVACDVAVVRPIDQFRMLEASEVLLAIEVSYSSLARDRDMKRLEYARAGIPHYWVVDVERRVIHRFAEPDAGDYLALPSLRFGEEVPVPGTDGAITLD